MTIIQDSQSIDAGQIARNAAASGRPINMGMLRVAGTPGPWTVRIRIDGGPWSGPDSFVVDEVPIDVIVREGGGRGGHSWGIPTSNQTRDISFVSYSSDLDVSVRVRPGNPQGSINVVAWLIQGIAPETAIATSAIVTNDLDGARAYIEYLDLPTPIPPDAHAIDVGQPSMIGLSAPTYPCSGVFLDSAGNEVMRFSLDGQTWVRSLPIPANARWFIVEDVAWAGTSIRWPVTYRRH